MQSDVDLITAACSKMPLLVGDSGVSSPALVSSDQDSDSDSLVALPEVNTAKPSTSTIAMTCRVSPTTKLPDLPQHLQSTLEASALDKYTRLECVRIWSEDLGNRTKGWPTKEEYRNYTKCIVTEYPIFGSGVDGKSNVSIFQKIQLF